MPLIENYFLQFFRGFQEDCHEFYDPIDEQLEQSYLESLSINNKFRSFCMLSKEFDVVEDTFTRSFRGLLNDGCHRKGKNVNWLEIVAMVYLSADKQDLQIFVQVIQVLICSIAYCFI